MTIEKFRSEVKRLAEELAADGILIDRVQFGRCEEDEQLFAIRLVYEDKAGFKQQEEEFYGER